MKLFKRIAAVLLAGMLALTVLAGCSGGGAPSTPLPSDEEALALYQGISETCTRYNVKTPVYNAELEQIAKDIAESVTLHKYYNDGPSTAVINKVKDDVAALAEGAEYINYDLNKYDTAVKSPLSTTNLKNNILQKGANRVGIVIVTLTNADTQEEVKYECTVYARFLDAQE